jgi:hypothetical protein
VTANGVAPEITDCASWKFGVQLGEPEVLSCGRTF